MTIAHLGSRNMQENQFLEFSPLKHVDHQSPLQEHTWAEPGWTWDVESQGAQEHASVLELLTLKACIHPSLWDGQWELLLDPVLACRLMILHSSTLASHLASPTASLTCTELPLHYLTFSKFKTKLLAMWIKISQSFLSYLSVLTAF